MSWLWVLIAIALIIAVMRFVHFKQRFILVLILAILLFGYITFAAASHNKTINLKTAPGIYNAAKIYFAWFGQVGGNLKTLTASAIKMDWVSKDMNVSFTDFKQDIMRG